MTRAHAQAMIRHLLLRERGFTLVEVMVAATVLVVGILGVVAIADGASKATASSQARDGGVNVSRRVIEAANSLGYADVTSAQIVAKLQAKPGLADASAASGWQVKNRNLTYTITTSLCNVDDPKDGTGTHDADSCPGAGPNGTTDAAPQDYKRVTAAVNWALATGSGSVQQATFVTPRGTADLPVVTSLTSSVNSPVTSASTTTVPFTATTSSVPAGVSWLKDGSVMGLASGSGNTWNFNWNINNLLDGDYVIGARPYDGAGSYGAPYYMTFTLNRNAPLAPTNFAAGYNSSDVSTEWLPNKERDVIGYTVKRQQTSPSAGAVTNVNCGTVGSPVYVTTKTTCKDAAPIPGAPSVDFVSQSSASSEVRNIVINKPANMQAGDVMIATIASGLDGTAQTTPTGWTRIRGLASSGGSQGIYMSTYYRVATASEAASYTFDGAKIRSQSGTITTWRGVDTTTPVDVSASISQNSCGSGCLSESAPAVTTTGSNRLLIRAFAQRGSGTTTTTLSLTTPTGTTFGSGKTSNTTINGQYSSLQAAAGASGTSVSTCSSTASACWEWVADTVALKPSSTPIAVNYWVVAVDRNAAGANREGAASNVVNAYAVNTRPNPPSNPTLTVQSDATRKLDWATAGSDPDAGDSVSFYRVYRDGVAYDRTSMGTDLTYTDPNRGGGSHTYYLVTVDSHLRESFATASVTG